MSARIHELVAQLFARDLVQTLPSSSVGYTQRIIQTGTTWPVVGATTAFRSTTRYLVAFSSNVVVSLTSPGFVLYHTQKNVFITIFEKREVERKREEKRV